MAMLAEPKRKTKWCTNPRGNLWSKDENKFGQKLLEKMGWSKGKGLGKHEDGNLEHIRVAYKNDNKGIGCEDNDSNWVVHQEDYNSLLTRLNQYHSETNDKAQKEAHNEDFGISNDNHSLEKRSKTFKSRVHYHKFVRGKDTSQYSKEDMDCILGTKIKHSANEHQEFEDRDKEVIVSNDYSDFNGVKTYCSTTSISDYFAEKMKKFKKPDNQLNDQPLHDGSNSEVEIIESSVMINDQEKTKRKKKHKKEKKLEKQGSESFIEQYNSSFNADNLRNSCNNTGDLKLRKPRVQNGISDKNHYLDVRNGSPRKRHHPDEDQVLKFKKKHCKMHDWTVPYVTDSPTKCLKKHRTDVDVSGITLKFKKKVTFSEEPIILSEETCSDGENKTVDANFAGNQEKECVSRKFSGCGFPKLKKKKKDKRIKHESSSELSSSSLTSESEAQDRLSPVILDEEENVPAPENRLTHYVSPTKKTNLGNNNESWVISQKRAMKMSSYKSVLNNIKSHDVLSTTNLLDIKGYGNW